MGRTAVWSALAAILLIASACDDAATNDGGSGGSGSGGSGSGGTGGSGSGGTGAPTCIDREAEGIVGSCHYTDMGFCATWYGAAGGDVSAWQSACEDQPGVWTTGGACDTATTLGSCKSTSEGQTVITHYYPGGMVSDTAMVQDMCTDSAASCQEFHAP